jgi:hypothetical protein
VDSYRWHNSHVSDVEAGIDEKDVSGHDERGQCDGDQMNVGQAQEERRHQDLVGQRVEKAAQHRRLALEVSSYPSVKLEDGIKMFHKFALRLKLSCKRLVHSIFYKM